MVPELTMTDLNELAINYSNLEMMKCVGTGGFGEVFTARLKPGNLIVAVKKLLLNADEEFDPTQNQVRIKQYYNNDNHTF